MRRMGWILRLWVGYRVGLRPSLDLRLVIGEDGPGHACGIGRLRGVRALL